MTKDARLEALRATVNPQPLGVPRAVLELRAQLAAEGAAGTEPGDNAVFEEVACPSQALCGSLVVVQSNSDNAGSRDGVVAESIGPETARLLGRVGASSAGAEMNDSSNDENVAGIIRYLQTDSLLIAF